MCPRVWAKLLRLHIQSTWDYTLQCKYLGDTQYLLQQMCARTFRVDYPVTLVWTGWLLHQITHASDGSTSEHWLPPDSHGPWQFASSNDIFSVIFRVPIMNIIYQVEDIIYWVLLLLRYFVINMCYICQTVLFYILTMAIQLLKLLILRSILFLKCSLVTHISNKTTLVIY